MQITKNSHPNKGGQVSFQVLLLKEMYEIAQIMGIKKTNDLHELMMALYPEECKGCTVDSNKVISCHKLMLA